MGVLHNVILLNFSQFKMSSVPVSVDEVWRGIWIAVVNEVWRHRNKREYGGFPVGPTKDLVLSFIQVTVCAFFLF